MAKLHEQIPHVSTPQLIREITRLHTVAHGNPKKESGYRIALAAEWYRRRTSELRRRADAGDALAKEHLATDFPKG